MLGALESSSGTGLKHQIIDLTVVAWFYHGVLEKRNELFESVKFVKSMHGNRICLNFSMAHRKPGLLSSWLVEHGNRICLNFSMAHRKPGLLNFSVSA